MNGMIENISPLLIVAIVAGFLSLYYLISLLFKLKKIKLISATKNLFGLIFFASICGFLCLISIGTQGYQTFNKEEPIAKIIINAYQQQNFQARLVFPDGSQQVFSLEGDELLIDAYILKWKPWANFLGLHTVYRLERISGRYQDINDEKNKPKSVHAISKKSGEGIAQWRESYANLSVLLDVEHGSASFVSAEKAKEYQLMVTTDGLLIRPLNETEQS